LKPHPPCIGLAAGPEAENPLQYTAAQVKDLRAIRDLLDHHMDDLDDVFAMLREHGVDGALSTMTCSTSPACAVRGAPLCGCLITMIVAFVSLACPCQGTGRRPWLHIQRAV